jgi:YHS domain-containing protein
VVLGPLLALLAFVCSVGIVPLAAALWAGGISFGGSIAFIFGDLITLPLLLIYRRYYGTGITLRLLTVFWGVMSVTALVTEYLFATLGLIPEHHPGPVRIPAVSWNYTTWLNVLALAICAGLYWLHRNRDRLGGGVGYTTDPICGMQIEQASAAAAVVRDGQTHFFCSDQCQARFTSETGRPESTDRSEGR